MKAFVGNRYLGEFPCGHWGSIAFLCPVCGEVWGRLVGGEGRGWHSLDRACPKHFTGGERGRELVPGSFLFALFWRVPERLLLEHMGKELLRHEVLMVLQEVERSGLDFRRRMSMPELESA